MLDIIPRKLGSVTELLAVFTICRQWLHQGVMGYLVRIIKGAVQRVFLGSITFLTTLFSELESDAPSGYTLKEMRYN